jgi:N-methylhydantoinase B
MTTATTTEYFMKADAVEEEYGIDLITAETLRNGLIEATRQMYGTLLRSSFSNIIRDGMDFGVCVHVVNPDGTTELAAITEGCTQFAFTHQHMTNMVLDEYGIENLGPGDTLVCNDSYRGGIHHGDLNFFRVVFDEEGKPAFVVSDAAHVFDIGGPAPGGFNNSATTLYEEGLRIPPTLITAGDRPVRPTINLLLENTRSPAMMIGDVRALLGTLKAGEERLCGLMDRHGMAAIKSAARYALGLSERRMRQALSEADDGDFRDEITIDDDGLVPEPITVRVEVRIRGAEAEIDFSGTDPQAVGAITTGWEEASRSIIGPKVILDPRHPMNAGAMRPFHVLLPPGSMVLALPPASQSNHTEMACKISRLMIRVLSRAFEPRAVADDSGTSGAIVFGGIDTRPGLEGTPFGGSLIFGEAWGGTQVSDGISFCLSPLFNCRSNVVEFTEISAPVLIWEYGIVMDGAGAGRHRGGFAPSYAVEALSEGFFTPLLDSAKFAPQGMDGGTHGGKTVGMLVEKDASGGVQSWNGILPSERLTPLFGSFDDQGRPDPVDGEFGNGTRFQTAKPTAMPLRPGEVFRVHVAGAGGYGSPLDREVEKVLKDVLNERVSPQQAEAVYGVVVDLVSGEVDEKATEATRERLRGGDTTAMIAHFGEWPQSQPEFQELMAKPPIGSGLKEEA